jgi:hypothetical protein
MNMTLFFLMAAIVVSAPQLEKRTALLAWFAYIVAAVVSLAMQVVTTVENAYRVIERTGLTT